ncbi:Vinorine synthase [Thalictrum thalictroides]|uniref:Vinorine synthase n=1 Tax=Thalictrum thalictroides TaxID=46969 RepID=A0A7J6V4L7_THATH|nr:Vinorine synthase [Thalictrum thalictroides]
MATSTKELENYPKLLQLLVGQLRKAITKLDSNGVRNFQYGDGVVEHMHSQKEAFELQFKNEVEVHMFSSWCRFPLYETNFGWGKPTRASPTFNIENLTVLMDTKCGKGIEASVCMVEEDMDNFECQPELIAFTSGGTPMS